MSIMYKKLLTEQTAGELLRLYHQHGTQYVPDESDPHEVLLSEHLKHMLGKVMLKGIFRQSKMHPPGVVPGGLLKRF